MRTLQLQSGVLYGPVHSRRLGVSLGINLMPTSYKLCPFNCVYCHYGWTDVLTNDILNYVQDLPSPKDVHAALEKAFQGNVAYEYVTFSGNGEPTLHPLFDEMVEVVRQLRQEYAPQVKLAILSNSSTIMCEKIRQALAMLDVKIMKLDAGDVQTFKRINRPHKNIDYSLIVENLQTMEGLILQSVFVDGKLNNVEDEALNHWMEKVGQIRPREVQIYSIDRPAADTTLKKVGRDKLEEIAHRTEEATGVLVRSFAAR